MLLLVAQHELEQLAAAIRGLEHLQRARPHLLEIGERLGAVEQRQVAADGPRSLNASYIAASSGWSRSPPPWRQTIHRSS